MGADYMNGDSPRSLVTTKGNSIVYTDVGDDGNSEEKADAVGLDLKFSNKDDVDNGLKEAVTEPTYSEVVKKDKSNEWATIKAGYQAMNDDYDNYEMHIQLGEGKDANLKLDNIQETKDKYENVKIDKNNY